MQSLGGTAVVGVDLGDRKEAVEGAPQLAGNAPEVERRRQHEDIRLLVGGIDLVHIVLLHAGTVGVLSAAVTTDTSADAHPLQEKGRDGMPGPSSSTSMTAEPPSHLTEIRAPPA